MSTVVGEIPWLHTAQEALSQLPEAEQARIQNSLAALAGVSWPHWPGDRLKKLPNVEAYVFSAGPDFRLFLRPPADGQGPPTVIDVVRKDTLASFATA